MYKKKRNIKKFSENVNDMMWFQTDKSKLY